METTARGIEVLVRRDFGVDVASVVDLEGGLDPEARLWRAMDADGGDWVVKATRRDVRFGLLLTDSLAARGLAGVGGPRRGPTGLPWTESDGMLVSIVPWIPGADAVTTATSLHQWRELGQTLRAVHDHPAPTAVRAERRGIRRSRESPRELVAAVDERLADGAVADSWRENRPRIENLLRLERRLKSERSTAQRVAVHGDPHLGNVIVDESGHPWLIDFDQAAVAPREVDLMLVELGVNFRRPIDDSQREAFRAGYGETAIDDERILRFGCVRAVEDLAATMHDLLDADSLDSRDMLAGLVGPWGLMALVEHRAG
jgi:spectinomycin phosphotransferase